jgi:hypothetical protein
MVTIERKAGEEVRIGSSILRVVEVQPGHVVFALLDADTDQAPGSKRPGRPGQRPVRPVPIRLRSCNAR